MRGWGEFCITDLFELSLPKGDIQTKGLDEGGVLLITPSNTNNGVYKRIPTDSKSTLYKAGCITVDMFGNSYYHTEQFFVTAHGHVNVLIPKIQINEYAGLFIATSIKSSFLQKYGFSDMCTLKVLREEKIKLPVNEIGKPDLFYMETYMRSIENKVKTSLNKIA